MASSFLYSKPSRSSPLRRRASWKAVLRSSASTDGDATARPPRVSFAKVWRAMSPARWRPRLRCLVHGHEDDVLVTRSDGMQLAVLCVHCGRESHGISLALPRP